MSFDALPTSTYRPSAETLRTAERFRQATSLEGSRVVVVGAGASGLAAGRLLRSRGAKVDFADDRALTLDAGRFTDISSSPVKAIESQALAEADLVVLSPGVPRSRPELAESIRRGVLVGEVELASWWNERPLIAITGTNGKSTTTALVGHLLGAAGLRPFVGGNLGRPASEMVGADHDIGVLELSSYQLESMATARFSSGLWLNLSPDHLDRYPDVAHYAAAKARLLELIGPGGSCWLNAEDEFLAKLGRDQPGVAWFSVGDLGPELEHPSLPGRHNRSNVAGAFAVISHLKLERDRLRQGLYDFPGLPHRLEKVRELEGVAYFNDSKATNVDSALTAVSAFSAPKILIAGGKDKGASWRPLVEAARGSVRVVLAIGEAAPIVMSAFRAEVPVTESVGDLASAVLRAQHLAEPGDIVLLSPACASFDQFQNFAHRGDEFRRLVSALAPRRMTDG